MVSGKDPNTISATLSSELNSCNKWLIENKLALHPGKCESILFGSKRKCKKVNSFEVTYNNTAISGQNNIKYLGSDIDRTLSGEGNVNNIIKKSNSKLKFLYRNVKYLDFNTNTLHIPHTKSH